MILIIGSVQDFITEMKKIGIRVDPDILFGQAASICARERIHVIWMVNEWDALITMVKFMNKVDEGNYMVPSRREPDLLAARLLGITPTQFMALKKKFGTLSALGKATDAELSQVYGIGKAKAKKIRETINLGCYIFRLWR
jgi:ERCC4-type nuclease